jgi:nitroimidazol reductase NimA-like FMN-containing flavoprotein (pyridoxamine 5'-phosphate oxidase superfamily)
MTDTEKKLLILAFIKTQTLTVLSTVGDGKPESAVIAFGETENLELIFGTSNTARKYKNLQNDPHVAFAIGWDPDAYMTVQYEGTARELAGDEAKKYSAAFAVKNPRVAKYASLPDERYFLVTPTWIRYTSKKETFEISF